MATSFLLRFLLALSLLSLQDAFVPTTRQPGDNHYHRLSVLSYALKKLPDGLVQYSQVPKNNQTFNAASIPKGLLKNHSTKPGTWGRIRVIQGILQYKIAGEPEIALDASTPGIIEPQVLHQVAPLSDDVEFVVEFHRYPDTGPVDEPREGIE